MTYAQIVTGSGAVVNLTGAIGDLSFTWIDITGLTCTDGSSIVPGCIYNGSTFASMPLDTYSRVISYSTDLTTDTYSIMDISGNQFQVQLSYGTSQSSAYITIESTNVPSLGTAQAQVRANLGQAQMTYVQSLYTLQTQVQFLYLYNQALTAGNLPNRVAYLSQIFPWIAALISYDLSFAATVNACSTAAQACALNGTWNFVTGPGVSNPAITGAAAIQINS